MLLFFDVETTGLPTRRGAPPTETNVWPRVVQIAWILADHSGKQLDAAAHFVKPAGFSIPEAATAIHGITTEKAKAEGILLSKVLRNFEAAVARCSSLIAHNMDFDKNVVAAEYIRSRMRTALDSKGAQCTMQLSTDYCRLPGGRYGQYKWPTLAELHYALFEREPPGQHNAAYDVRACMKSYFKLQELGLIAPPDTESEDPRELIDEILDLAAERDSFDLTFVESVAEQLKDRGRITEKQRDALIRIRDGLNH